MRNQLIRPRKGIYKCTGFIRKEKEVEEVEEGAIGGEYCRKIQHKTRIINRESQTKQQ